MPNVKTRSVKWRIVYLPDMFFRIIVDARTRDAQYVGQSDR
jgi:hypothetical protein